MKANFAVLLIAFASVLRGADIVTDEATRLKVLAALFPGMAITATPTAQLNDTYRVYAGKVPFDLPDVLKDEKVYRVTGDENRPEEKCASDDASGKHPRSSIRQVRFQAFELPAGEMLAVMQYKFMGANPAAACPSLARIARLKDRDGQLAIATEFSPDTAGHHRLLRIEIAPLGGEGTRYLLVESDAGGADQFTSELYIFDLAEPGLKPVLANDVRVYEGPRHENVSSSDLDLDATIARHGIEFCFARTIYAEGGTWFDPPRIGHACYKRLESVEPQ